MADNNGRSDPPLLWNWRLPTAVDAGPDGSPVLPMSKEEMTARGWDQCDIIIVTGDGYIDHPSFGAAVVGRLLEWLGYRVGIIARPDTQDVEAFRALGPPRLFWGITAGNLDSNLARLTVMRKLRRDDPYAPGGKAGGRPANASIVYTSKARQAFKGIPVVLGGIEASLRRFAYYDYWTDTVRRSLLFDAKADLIVYGMAERAIAELALRAAHGLPLRGIAGTCEPRAGLDGLSPVIELPSFEDVSKPTAAGRLAFADMARAVHHQLAATGREILVQRHGPRFAVVQPPAAPLTGAELDLIYALPFTKLAHPSYGGAHFPAQAMIRDSITTHRGCYGGCSFCAIGHHQGTVIVSRSEQSVVDEVRRLVRQPGFHGTVSDLGGPTANMYGTGCRLKRQGCPNRNCLVPEPCANLVTDHQPVLSLLAAVHRIPGVNHVFVTSGIRFDLAMTPGAGDYLEQLVARHVCGRLKIAPEHVVRRVLEAMRKPAPDIYFKFTARFAAALRNAGKPYQLIEYFISGHPGCSLEDMAELARYLKRAGLQPEQVQDFYPAPMTLAAAMYYTGIDPLTGESLPVARTDRDKSLQRALLLSHLPQYTALARQAMSLAKNRSHP